MRFAKALAGERCERCGRQADVLAWWEGDVEDRGGGLLPVRLEWPYCWRCLLQELVEGLSDD